MDDTQSHLVKLLTDKIESFYHDYTDKNRKLPNNITLNLFLAGLLLDNNLRIEHKK